MRKSTYPWLFSIIVLVVLLIITFILGYTGYFFSLSYLKSNTDLNLGESILINIEPNKTSVSSFTFDGSIMPGEKLNQVIQIKGSDLEKDLRVRVKAEVFFADKVIDFDFVTTDDFVKGNDGYFYLNGELASGNKVTFSNFIVVPGEAIFESSKKYILSIIVGNLDATLDVDNIWQFQEENV